MGKLILLHFFARKKHLETLTIHTLMRMFEDYTKSTEAIVIDTQKIQNIPIFGVALAKSTKR